MLTIVVDTFGKRINKWFQQQQRRKNTQTRHRKFHIKTGDAQWGTYKGRIRSASNEAF